MPCTHATHALGSDPPLLRSVTEVVEDLRALVPGALPAEHVADPRPFNDLRYAPGRVPECLLERGIRLDTPWEAGLAGTVAWYRAQAEAAPTV